MHISGVIVACPAGLGDVEREVRLIPGVEVHFVDGVTGRIILTLETDSASAQQGGLEQITTLRGVLHAAVVYHYVHDAADAAGGGVASCPPGA